MLNKILKFFKRDKSGFSDNELRKQHQKNFDLLGKSLIIWGIITGIIFVIMISVTLSSYLVKIAFIIYAIIQLLTIVFIIAVQINIYNLQNQIIKNYQAKEQNKIQKDL